MSGALYITAVLVGWYFRWAGLIRGAVSVALAYYQFDREGGSPDAERSTLIVTTLSVVLVSILVLGALTKPLLALLLRESDESLMRRLTELRSGPAAAAAAAAGPVAAAFAATAALAVAALAVAAAAAAPAAAAAAAAARSSPHTRHAWDAYHLPPPF